MDEILDYEAAYNELREIASGIASASVSVDVLAEKVKRASFLISFCQTRLKSTETEVNKIISKMEKSTNRKA